MLEDLRELWKYRELLFIFVQRDLKVRYKNSILGVGWSLVNPLVQVITITIVLQFLAGKGTLPENYHTYVFCAMLPWLFFSTALADSTNSLIYYHGLIRKTYFPREILPLATVTANLIHFGIALVVFIGYAIVNPLFNWAFTSHVLNWPLIPTVFLLPIPILGLAVLVSGLACFVSVWTLYFEDMRYIVDSGLKILYWAVPVLYFSESIYRRYDNDFGRLLYQVYMLNPLAGFITAFRKFALTPTKFMDANGIPTQGPGMTGNDWLYLGVAWLSALLIFWLGHRYFTARKWTLAERA